VRTRGAGGRSWLLIKHRDEWAGPIDIAEFAPLSVKSGGDFADILAEENPSIWVSHRPAEGGDAGAMFKRIVERALALEAEREGHAAPAPSSGTRKPSAGTKKAPARSATKTAAAARPAGSTAARPKRPARASTARARKTKGA
jgi:hypothetical protein